MAIETTGADRNTASLSIQQPDILAAFVLSLAVARDQAQSKAHREDLRHSKVAILASEGMYKMVCHAAQISGIGTKAVHPLPNTCIGYPDATALDEAIAMQRSRGCNPIFLAIAETNEDTRALQTLSQASRRRQLWLHLHLRPERRGCDEVTLATSHADSTSVALATGRNALVWFKEIAAFRTAQSLIPVDDHMPATELCA